MDQSTWLIVGGLVLVVAVAAIVIVRRNVSPSSARPVPEPLEVDASGADESIFGPIGPDGLVQVLQPMARRAVAQAYRRGGPAARYIVERGGEFYFDLNRIQDKDERRRAHEVIERIQAGGIDVRDVLRLVRMLTGEQ